MKRIHFLCALCLFMFLQINLSYAQNNINALRDALANFIPTNSQLPSAAAMVNNINNQPNLYSGTSKPSIPLYSFQKNGLSLNLGLEYIYGNGIKVNELASEVGLGWNITGLGEITREVFGLPDENNFMTDPTVRDFFIDNNLISGVPLTDFATEDPYKLQLLARAAIHELDFQPDIFYVSAPVLGSMKFVWMIGEQKFVSTKNRNIKILFEPGLEGFTIIDHNGYKYEFTTMIKLSVANELSYPISSSSSSFQTSNHSWKLTKIVNADKTDSIEFHYRPFSEQQYYSFGNAIDLYRILVYSNAPAGSELSGCSFSRNRFSGGHYINYIKTKQDSICFNYGSQTRLDIQGQGNFPLENIKIYRNSSLVSGYKFFQSYYIRNTVSHNTPYAIEDTKSLKLDSICLLANNNTLINQSYKFTYDASGLAKRLTNANDYWGFYNGRNSNTTNIPQQTYRWQNSLYVAGTPNVDRNFNHTFTKSGILTKIDYPLGGSVSYEYGPNYYKHFNTTPPYYLDGVSVGLPAVLINYNNFNFSNIYSSDTFDVDYNTEMQFSASISTDIINSSCYNFLQLRLRKILPDNSVVVSYNISMADVMANSRPFSWNEIDPEVTKPLSNGRYILDIVNTSCLGGLANQAVLNNRDFMPMLFCTVLFKQLNRSQQNTYSNAMTGGLRIESIIEEDKTGSCVYKKFIYSDKDGLSTGNNTFSPQYSGIFYLYFFNTNQSQQLLESNPYFLASSNNLHGGKEQTTTYTNVYEVVVSGNDSLMTNYQFEGGSTRGSSMFPFTPQPNLTVSPGRVVVEKKYLNGFFGINSSQLLLDSVQYNYNSFCRFDNDTNNSFEDISIPGIAASYGITNITNGVMFSRGSVPQYSYYNLWMQHLPLESTIQTSYRSTELGGNVSYKTETQYKYGVNTEQPIWTQTITPSGDVFETHSILSGGEPTNNLNLNASVKTALIQNNRFNDKRAEIVYKNNQKLTTTVAYDKMQGPMYLIDSVKTKTFENPYELQYKVLSYNADGKPLIVEDKAHRSSKFIWTPQSKYLNAKCENINASDFFFFSDFEYDDNTAAGLLASKGYRLQNNSLQFLISTIHLTGKYVVYAWVNNNTPFYVNNVSSNSTGKTNNGWTLHSLVLAIGSSSTITVSGSGIIDNLAIMPLGATMNAVVYDPLDRIWMSTNGEDLITYEYDNENRLKATRNSNGMLINVQEYGIQVPE